MAIANSCGDQIIAVADDYPYTVNIQHDLKKFYQIYPWTQENIPTGWRMTINNTHYVFHFKQKSDSVRFTLACL